MRAFKLLTKMNEFSQDMAFMEGIFFLKLALLKAHFCAPDMHVMILGDYLFTRKLKSGMVTEDV